MSTTITTSTDSCTTAATEPLLDLVGADLRVPLVDGRWVRHVNLDLAASAPALRVVADRVAAALPYYSSVHRGAGYASQVSTAVLERSRRVIGEYVGARAGDAVVLARNTTDALSLLAGCVPAGGEVVYLDLEHHANLLPWQRLPHRAVVARPTVAETLAALEQELAARPVALLAVTGASNVTGEELPIARLVGLAHRHGARVVVDAAQLAPHRRLSLAATDVDYVVFSGHKLYAPYGVGALVGRQDWLDTGTPYLPGGGAVVSVGVDSVEWACAPHRHEGGTPNVLGALALATACETLAALPAGAQELHEAALRQRLVHVLHGLRGVRLHRIFDEPLDRQQVPSIGVVTFTVDGYDAGLVAAYLSAEHGISVRDGRFCAHPLTERLGLGDGAVRVSIGVGSTQDDVDRLVDAVAALIAEGPRTTYERIDGRWAPVADPRPLPAWAGGADRSTGASPCTA
ncbi:aminotransferase class V-fold PLP-dependent enzyme [Nocardioides speluncae]|uniref:aminotransferase class V-fold PLP-dependent enzyme n=1 Tax=Nocardioides speluncae TaxID=2670337 RepID=UPI000D69DF7D|nr:aminotransferase class V-fold PLP-dependent enzyme [Nocardioides speluncae]